MCVRTYICTTVQKRVTAEFSRRTTVVETGPSYEKRTEVEEHMKLYDTNPSSLDGLVFPAIK